MDFERYLENLPNLHSWDQGRTWNSGGFGKEHLGPLHRFIRDHALRRIVETGAGNSTVTFLYSQPEQLISIAPDAPLFDRIEAYCRDQGVSLEPLKKIVGRSEWELPKLAAQARGSMDFALIDGCHGWPQVFVDFFYVDQLVRSDGFLMIDDVQLHSVAELVNMLDEQPGYARVLDLEKSLIYRKSVVDSYHWEWHVQPYIARLSRRRSRWISGLRKWLRI